MATMEEAEKATMFANIAFQEGYRQAQQDVRRALGIEKVSR
jgi:hypothetical protein